MIETRTIEEKIGRLFSEKKPFSEHLSKWEDNLLPDKYDHNCFEYSGQPSEEEFRRALQHQKDLGVNFIKLEGDSPLDDSFGLEEGVTVTMVLSNCDVKWKINNALAFETPSLREAEEIEVKHYGSIYGEDFSRRNIRRLFEELEYHGAYLNERLVGICHSYTTDGMTCIDGLLVDSEYRNQKIATSLIDHIRKVYPDTQLMLHAETDDSPKDMYSKMGFETVDMLYEYSCTDISSIE